jgi:hypothetical protein
MRQAPSSIPVQTLHHLSTAEIEAAPELVALRALLDQGWAWRGVALAARLEEQFYRSNNLPPRLAELYHDLDPADPDEDIVEEAEPEALALVSHHYLLDETVDAFYDAVASLPQRFVLRRAGWPNGRLATHPRGGLLALKHLFQDDWRVDALMDRLALTASLAIDARPVLLGPAGDAPNNELSARASHVLGYPVKAWADAGGHLTRALPG